MENNIFIREKMAAAKLNDEKKEAIERFKRLDSDLNTLFWLVRDVFIDYKEEKTDFTEMIGEFRDHVNILSVNLRNIFEYVEGDKYSLKII